MKTSLTAQAPTLTRKQARKAHMDRLLMAACQEAIDSSLVHLKKTAWVYLNTPLGGKASFFVRVSQLPEIPYQSPTATMKLVAGFQKGKKVLG